MENITFNEKVLANIEDFKKLLVTGVAIYEAPMCGYAGVLYSERDLISFANDHAEKINDDTLSKSHYALNETPSVNAVIEVMTTLYEALDFLTNLDFVFYSFEDEESVEDFDSALNHWNSTIVDVLDIDKVLFKHITLSELVFEPIAA